MAKKQVGPGDVDPDVRKIAEALEDLDNESGAGMPDFGAMGMDDKPEALPMPALGKETGMAPEMGAPEGEQWVLMCHGTEEGEKLTEVWGPYTSKDEAVAALRDCIKTDFGDEALAGVEGQLENGHVEIEGWTKVVVPLKSPDAGESEAPEAPAKSSEAPESEVSDVEKIASDTQEPVGADAGEDEDDGEKYGG